MTPLPAPIRKALRLAVPLAALAALSASNALAQENEYGIDCEAAVATVETRYCAQLAFEAADDELNRLYREITAELEAGIAEDDWNRERLDALRTAQRSWVAFRDADCEGSAGTEWQNGTGRMGAEAACMEAHTRARTDMLLDRFGSADEVLLAAAEARLAERIKDGVDRLASER